MERAKNIAQQELEKLEKNEKSELKRLHERKIMEIQQRYQEDMENIGQAHLAAILESETLAGIEDETERNREVALKRGKEALEQLKRTVEKVNNIFSYNFISRRGVLKFLDNLYRKGNYKN